MIMETKELRHIGRFSGKIKGKYVGCFSGCMTQIEYKTLGKVAEEMQLPLWLVSVAETIFMGLPKKKAIEFSVKFINASRAKKDHQKSYRYFFYNILMDEKKGQIAFTEKDSKHYKSIIQCAELFKSDKIYKAAGISVANSAFYAVLPAESIPETIAWAVVHSISDRADMVVHSANLAAQSIIDFADLFAKSNIPWNIWSDEWPAAKSNHYLWMRDLLLKSVK